MAQSPETDTDTSSDEDDNYFADEAATFGDRVVAARRELGLSAEGLAKRLGIAGKTLARWENDQSEPRANKLQMLAGVLNVSMVWLLTGEGEGISEGQSASDAASVELMTELRALRHEAAALSRRAARLEKAFRLRSIDGG